jgi:hypothetical protein
MKVRSRSESFSGMPTVVGPPGVKAVRLAQDAKSSSDADVSKSSGVFMTMISTNQYRASSGTTQV